MISTTQTIYVYTENGDRYVCSDKHEFTITITPEPTQLTLPNIEGCTSVELPILNIPEVTVEYHLETKSWRTYRSFRIHDQRLGFKYCICLCISYYKSSLYL